MAGLIEGLNLIVDLDASGLESKINSVVGSLVGSFKKLEDIDINALMKNLSSGGINWSTIVSKLFSPANLIAFFSAMAATGIIASISQQSAGSSAGGSTGTGGDNGGTQDQLYGSEAATIAGNAGTLAGSTSDIASTIAQIYQVISPFGGTVQDATTATQALVEALTTTGGQLSDAVGPIITDIKEAGITTAGGITNFIGALEEASQAAGGAGQGASIANVANATQSPIAQAAKGGVDVNGLISIVQEFGAMAASIGFPNAVAELGEMGDLLDDPVKTEMLGLPNLATIINTSGANAAFDLMNTKVAAIYPSLSPTVLASLQLSPIFLDAVAAFNKFQEPITNTYNGIVALGSPTANIAKQFAAYDNIILAGNEAINLMQASLANFVNAPLLTTLLNGFDDVLKVIKDITSWLNQSNLLSDVSTFSVLGFLATVVPGLIGGTATVLGKIGSFFGLGGGSTATGATASTGASSAASTAGSGLLDASGAPLASSALSEGASSGIVAWAGGLLDTLLSPTGIGAAVGALYNFAVPAQYGGGVQSVGGDYPTGQTPSGNNPALSSGGATLTVSLSPGLIGSLQQKGVNGITTNSSTNKSYN